MVAHNPYVVFPQDICCIPATGFGSSGYYYWTIKYLKRERAS